MKNKINNISLYKELDLSSLANVMGGSSTNNMLYNWAYDVGRGTRKFANAHQRYPYVFRLSNRKKYHAL